MVSHEVPKNYSASPSSFVGTPHLTINREAIVDLDSSNAFEGPEKLLEVWFAPSPTNLPTGCDPRGLKAVPAEAWTAMLDLVNCKVLSILESESFDAYLLSESSMFVWPHKLILKTCGTTTLLYGLPRILELAALTAGFPHADANLIHATPAAAAPHRLFYSRKNFLNPLQQKGPHRSWRDEVGFLDKLFMGGSAYMIGKMNGDHWYLYTTGPGAQLTPPASPNGTRVPTETKWIQPPPTAAVNGDSADEETEDETLEILMTDLEPKNARQFYLADASAIASGRYLREAKQARRDALDALGTIPEHPSSTVPMHDVDDFDVFEQTSSDHSSFASQPSSSDNELAAGAEKLKLKDDEDLTCPEELTTEGHALGTVVSDVCGLSSVYPTSRYPDARIDSYLFTPCGFSANGIVPAPSSASGAVTETNASQLSPPVSTPSTAATAAHYFTVHVTPEPHCSYASFETNVPGRQSGRHTAEVVEDVVNIFKPGRFSVTLFETKKSAAAAALNAGPGGNGRRERLDRIEGYRRVDRIVHDLDGYDLVFRYYERLDWVGGGPRIGEEL